MDRKHQCTSNCPHELDRQKSVILKEDHLPTAIQLYLDAEALIPMTCYAGHPVVQFVSGPEEVVGPEKWTVRCGGGKFATRRQLPLKLAWAISIHKSQVSEKFASKFLWSIKDHV